MDSKKGSAFEKLHDFGKTSKFLRNFMYSKNREFKNTLANH